VPVHGIKRLTKQTIHLADVGTMLDYRQIYKRLRVHLNLSGWSIIREENEHI
jgi:hypothetical protein